MRAYRVTKRFIAVSSPYCMKEAQKYYKYNSNDHYEQLVGRRGTVTVVSYPKIVCLKASKEYYSS